MKRDIDIWFSSNCSLFDLLISCNNSFDVISKMNDGNFEISILKTLKLTLLLIVKCSLLELTLLI